MSAVRSAIARRPGGTRRQPREAGFTLVEILLAMLIFMAGVAGIYGLLSTALGMQRQGMDTARATRNLERLVFQLEQELSAGLHWDGSAERWVDVDAAQLPDGIWYRVGFRPLTAGETGLSLLAQLRLASSRAGLERARPVDYLLTPGPTAAAAVRAYRRRSPTR